MVQGYAECHSSDQRAPAACNAECKRSCCTSRLQWDLSGDRPAHCAEETLCSSWHSNRHSMNYMHIHMHTYSYSCIAAYFCKQNSFKELGCESNGWLEVSELLRNGPDQHQVVVRLLLPLGLGILVGLTLAHLGPGSGHLPRLAHALIIVQGLCPAPLGLGLRGIQRVILCALLSLRPFLRSGLCLHLSGEHLEICPFQITGLPRR